MFGLQKLYEDETSKAVSPENLGLNLLENRLKEINLYLTKKQRLKLKEHFQAPEKDTITFDFSDKQLSSRKFPKKDIQKELDEVMQKVILDIQNFEKKLPNIHEDAIENFKNTFSSTIYEKLLKTNKKMLKDEIQTRKIFNQNLQELWKEPLNLLHTIIVMVREIGSNYFNGQFHIDTSFTMDLTEKLLVRINARAIQIAEEILVLLKNGFADGAEARWRTLHELTVVSAFIAKHGNSVAEQYIDHELVEQYKMAKQHNQYNIQLGASKIPLDEIKLLEEKYLKLLDKYGENYKSNYGWASSTLNNKRPTFSAIEASVEFDHYRPYYKSASANIHAGSYSIFSRLGLLHEEEDIVLSGSSHSGLASAGQSTALSLTQITVSMLTYNTTMDSLVACELLKKYSDETNIVFGDVENMMWECTE